MTLRKANWELYCQMRDRVFELERDVAELREATIEECAKVCDELADDPFFKVGAVMQKAAMRIRALKGKP